MSRTDIWMPLYIGDYLSDTMSLEAREHGAYLLLIMHYWRNGPLPDDDRALAGIGRVDRKTWLADTGPIVRAFFEARDGKLHHKRIDSERAAAQTNADTKRAAANARWGKSKGPGTSGGGANAVQEECTSNAYASQVDAICTSPSPSPSPSPKEEGSKKEPPVQPPSVSATVASRPAPPTRTVEARGVRLPEDWQPSAADRAFAASLGVDPDAVAAEFRAYWLALPGAKGRKAGALGWSMTYQNRCRDRAAHHKPLASPSHTQRRLAQNGAIELMIQARERASDLDDDRTGGLRIAQ